MYNRAAAVDAQFTAKVKQENFPSPMSDTGLLESGLKSYEAIEIFESQILSRQWDLVARELKADGASYYTIGSSGHEGNAALGKIFGPKDMAFLHYRSGAFMAQRYKWLAGQTPIYDILLSLTACEEDPIAGGRHKVWGSLPLNVPPQTSTIASHLPKAVGMALSISRNYELGISGQAERDAVVYCSFGDASANHSTAQGAFNTASWIARQNIKLPLLFVCEDNGLGISVPTDENWIADQFSQKTEINYFRADGLNLFDVYLKGRQAESYLRKRKKPVFLHLETVRLMGHAGSDVEINYRQLSDIEATEAQDPLLHSARLMIENGLMTADEVLNIYGNLGERVRQVAKAVCQRKPLRGAQNISATMLVCTKPQVSPEIPSEQQRQVAFGKDFVKLKQPYHLAKLLNFGLCDLMLRYSNIVLFGEDVSIKGGVYNVTDGLYKKFSRRRVFNSILDEQSILGTAIGMAHNGFLPIPEIQFLAYLHNAEDQIRGEAATLSFFSQGQFTNPMVVRIAGLAYQKGFGGHFHNDNSLSVLRDIPGLILAVPARGDDAVKMLRTCVRLAYEQGRVAVFVEPIARYMTKDLYEENDRCWSFEYPDPEEEIPLGEMGVYKDGTDYAIITYGNGVYLSLQAMEDFEKQSSKKGKLIDLRWLNDIDKAALMKETQGISKILVVEECRRRGSTSEEVLSLLVENQTDIPLIRIHAARECLIPLGPGAADGLPSRASILDDLKSWWK